MVRRREIAVNPAWRLFRPGSGRASGPPPFAYVGLYLLCLAISQWNAARYGTIVIWPANGVALAALLQLHRRDARRVLAACFLFNLAANVLRGDVPYMVMLNAGLNFAEIFAAGLLARRFCGAAMDLRRPARLARFALIAAAVAFVAAVIGIASLPFALESVLVSLQTWFTVDALSLILITPPLLLMARRGGLAAEDGRSGWEKAGLILLLVAVTAGVFAQSAAPILFIVFLPLLLIAFRLSPGWAALAVLLVALIGGAATLNGYGPITLSRVGPSSWGDANLLPVLRTLPIFQLFTTVILCVALTASTVLTERRRLEARLRARTEAAVAARLRIAHLAAHDPETDLPNRTGLAAAAAALIERRRGRPVLAAALGIERFAAIRAAIGAAQAANLLGRTADIVAARLSGASVGRLADDTIGIVFAAPDMAAAARRIGTAVAAFDAPVALADDRVDVRLLAGLALCPDHAGDAAGLIERARIALDQARSARAGLSIFDAEAERQAAGGLTLLSELRAGLDMDALHLVHQPKLDLRSGAIAGFESLIRWTHPTRGPIPPDRFMPLVEETGFIEPLTDWVLARAIGDQAALDGRGIRADIAINLSARSLAEPALAKRLMAIVAAGGGDSSRITLEITETAIMTDMTVALANLDQLKRLGFRIAIDDYGTGLSSLAYLRRIPADSLKIDRSFVTDLGVDARSLELVRSTIDLGHRLGLTVVGEGVETEAQLALLSLLGCDQAQGFLIGRPCPVTEIDASSVAGWARPGHPPETSASSSAAVSGGARRKP